MEAHELAGAIESEQIVEFLAALHRRIGKKLLISWDGRGVPTSRRVRNCLEAQNGRLAIAFLLPTAPELNPIEAIRAYLKKDEITSL